MPNARLLGFLRLMALLLIVGFSAAYPDVSYAAEAPAAEEGAEGARSQCEFIREQIALFDNDGVYLIESTVTCIKAVIVGDARYGITGAFGKFLLAFYPVFEPIIRVALTLAVALFGAMMLAGLIEKPARDSFVVLMKLACVMYFVQTSTAQWIFDSSLKTLDGMTEMVFTFGQTGEMEGRCRIRSGDGLWDRVDCMMDVLIGIKMDAPGAEAPDAVDEVSASKSGISRGMMHFFFANISSSGLGAVIGFLGLYTIYSFSFAVLKSLHTYLAAVLGLAFILVLTPMFVPMLMFKSTKNYFEKWYRIAISFILQPVILFGFLSLMMVAFDTVLVSGNNSVLRMIIGDKAETQVPSEVLEEEGVYNVTRVGETGAVLARANDLKGYFSEEMTGAMKGRFATPEGTTLRDEDGNIPGVNISYYPMDGIDYARLATEMEGVGDDAEAKERLAYAAIVLALTTFVFISTLNYIPTMATDLAGGVFEVPNLYESVGQKFVGADQLEGAAYNLSATVRQKLGDGSYFAQIGSMLGGRKTP